MLLTGDDGSSKGAGFYMEQFAAAAGMPAATMSELGLLANSMAAAGNQEVIAAGLGGGVTGQAQQQGMYDSVMNYAMKPEKGMPPTPPGNIPAGT